MAIALLLALSASIGVEVEAQLDIEPTAVEQTLTIIEEELQRMGHTSLRCVSSCAGTERILGLELIGGLLEVKLSLRLKGAPRRVEVIGKPSGEAWPERVSRAVRQLVSPSAPSVSGVSGVSGVPARGAQVGGAVTPKVLVSLGGVSLVTSVVFFGLFQSTRSALEARRAPSGQIGDLNRQLRWRSGVALGLLGGAFVAISVGVSWLLWAR